MPFDPVAYINTPRWQHSRLGLDRMRALLERLGRPQDALRFVHVAGTNGKGSTCAYLASVLRAAGYRTGLFTSPYILRFEERIRVDGADITPDELRAATLAVRDEAAAIERETGEHPTEFELMLAVALVHFRAASCDIVVLEVGLGGRLDATNVIDAPEACVIARIGLDHTALLGDTLAAVAGEKCGIVKPGAPVASWPQDPEAMAEVEAACAEAACALAVMDPGELRVEPLGARGAAGDAGAAPAATGAGAPREAPGPAADGGDARLGEAAAGGAGSAAPLTRRFSYRGESFETALLGSYQPANAALAVEAIGLLRGRGWRIPDEAVRAGIAAARWPGRFEVVADQPLTVVDGGHNPQGAQALADSLRDLLAALDASGVADGEGGAGASGVAPGEGGAGASRGGGASGGVDGEGGLPAPWARRGAGVRRVVLVMGVLADKDYRAMIEVAAPLADAVVCYAPCNPRALPAADLTAAWGDVAAGVPAQLAPDAEAALARGRELAGPDGVCVAFGSLYAIADLSGALAKNATH
ncbi:MAG: bifunctional folylpolyglutamate synthase/dihydrofolate synthase [Eggerthellaceae bacterium]|nr:bifunctional folylpolyglutamate synthase/dihydrofolate synthase [Eggerthellaceae bacterium]